MRRFTASGSRADVDAADRGGARRRPQQAAEHADGGGLAGAVAAEEAEDLAGAHVERHVVDGDEGAEPAREAAAPRWRSSPQRPSRAAPRPDAPTRARGCDRAGSAGARAPRRARRSARSRRRGSARPRPGAPRPPRARLRRRRPPRRVPDAISSERCRTSTASTESNSREPLRARPWRRQPPAPRRRATRPPSHSDQVTLTPASHESSQRSMRGKMSGIRPRVVEPAAHGDHRASAGCRGGTLQVRGA